MSLMSGESPCPFDPFKNARQSDGVLPARLDGETIPMILRLKEVRAAAKDWKTFSSDAPFRVPIPSEESRRSVRQLPIETDPPAHTEYRAIAEPFFRQPRNPEFAADIERLVEAQVSDALARRRLEVMEDFALPLQNRALARLLNVPQSEADTWIGWGMHVFHEGPDGTHKGAELEAYLNARFDRAAEAPGDDFFSALARAEFRGRRLTREELLGFANLTFAGGRDTLLLSITHAFGHLAKNPQTLDWLREDPRRINPAAEELFRTLTPLSHIGRVCPRETDVHGVKVAAGGRVALNWASANFDETVFDEPEEIRLDRKPNPHIAFGFGPHICLGVHHARLLVRTLLAALGERLDGIAIRDEEAYVETREDFERRAGYTRLDVTLRGRA